MGNTLYIFLVKKLKKFCLQCDLYNLLIKVWDGITSHCSVFSENTFESKLRDQAFTRMFRFLHIF